MTVFAYYYFAEKRTEAWWSKIYFAYWHKEKRLGLLRDIKSSSNNAKCNGIDTTKYSLIRLFIQQTYGKWDQDIMLYVIWDHW